MDIYIAGFMLALGCSFEDENTNFSTRIMIAFLSWFAVGMMLASIYKNVEKEEQDAPTTNS